MDFIGKVYFWRKKEYISYIVPFYYDQCFETRILFWVYSLTFGIFLKQKSGSKAISNHKEERKDYVYDVFRFVYIQVRESFTRMTVYMYTTIILTVYGSVCYIQTCACEKYRSIRKREINVGRKKKVGWFSINSDIVVPVICVTLFLSIFRFCASFVKNEGITVRHVHLAW